MSSNRAQRRAAAKHKGKRPGETYAEYLARERQIRESIDKSVHDTSVEIIADQKRQILLWESVVAINRRFGYAEKGPWTS
jgi:2-phosphoglycerate kinase